MYVAEDQAKIRSAPPDLTSCSRLHIKSQSHNTFRLIHKSVSSKVTLFVEDLTRRHARAQETWRYGCPRWCMAPSAGRRGTSHSSGWRQRSFGRVSAATDNPCPCHVYVRCHPRKHTAQMHGNYSCGTCPLMGGARSPPLRLELRAHRAACDWTYASRWSA
jgi:hypothetical protein